MFLLVPAHPGCLGQFPQSCKTVVCVCVCVFCDLNLKGCSIVCKVAGAVLVVLSLTEFVWYATTFFNEKVVDKKVPNMDMAGHPMPADLMAALIQMMTFVSFLVPMFLFWIFISAK